MKYFQTIFIIFASAILFTPRVQAVEFKTGESVNIGSDEVLSGSLFVSGSTIIIDAPVHGDVYCAGKSVVITSVVDGDIICAGQTLRVEGKVGGNIRVAAQTITLSGAVGKNVSTMSQSLTVEHTATIGGELLYAVQTATIAGTSGSIAGVSETTTLAGMVRGDVLLEAQSFNIDSGAKVNGSLSYVSQKETMIPDGATVSGVISFKPIPKSDKEEGKFVVRSSKEGKRWPINALPSVLFYTLLGLIIAAIFPRAVVRVQKNMQQSGLLSGAVGVVAIMGAPFLFLFLLVSIVGILAIPFVALLYVIATCFGRIVGATLVGRGILDGFNVKSRDNLFLQVFIGIPILWIMFKAPFVGGLLALISIFWGLGGVFLSLRKGKK